MKGSDTFRHPIFQGRAFIGLFEGADKVADIEKAALQRNLCDGKIS